MLVFQLTFLSILIAVTSLKTDFQIFLKSSPHWCLPAVLSWLMEIFGKLIVFTDYYFFQVH